MNRQLKDESIRVEAAAYGRGGMRTIDLLIWARKNVESFSPDVVILMLGINDLALNGGPEYTAAAFESRLAEREAAPTGTALTRRLKYSQLYRQLVRARQQWIVRRQIKAGKIIEWHSQNLPRLKRGELLRRLPFYRSGKRTRGRCRSASVGRADRGTRPRPGDAVSRYRAH